VSFTVATYNVLADAYIRREWYPLTPDDVLEPARRRSALLAHLVELGADLLCLQEVEPAVFAAIDQRLGPLSYTGVFSQKGRRKADGCAVFFRDVVFERDADVRLEYVDARAGQKSSGHVAQLVSLGHEGRRLGIANTHLKWDPPGTPRDEQYGYRQVAQLVGECDQRLLGCSGWIICGDLNATPNSDLIAFLQRAGFKSTHAFHAHTSNINGIAKTIDYIFHNAALSVEPLPLPTVSDQTVLPRSEEPSDHVAVLARFAWR
jgi:mRNA deadenylase 3'-5' endonuclease subunit Ccr4